MENLFDLQSIFKTTTNPKTSKSTMMNFLVNRGTLEHPKFINLGTLYLEIEKCTFTMFFKKHKDIFTWTYEDMKTYDNQII
jgi:hypothetical protein